jgi:hypothetical protein
MHEALCRPSSTTLDMVHAEDGPPITQRTSGLKPWLVLGCGAPHDFEPLCVGSIYLDL